MISSLVQERKWLMSLIISAISHEVFEVSKMKRTMMMTRSHMVRDLCLSWSHCLDQKNKIKVS